MDAFEYVAPRTLDEAYAAMSNGKTTALLAGGTDVIVQLRENRRHADQVLDVKHIPELMALKITADGGLSIGAAVPCAVIYENAEIAAKFPAVIDSASLIGGIQIQGRASLGGNVCNASPAADSIPSLIAQDTRLVIGSKSGTRELPIEEFFAGPGKNNLQPGELLIQLKIPAPKPRSGAFFNRFIPRNEMDIAVVNAGARIQLADDGETIADAKVAIGAVAPTPLVVPAAAQALIGKPANEETFAAAGEASAAAATPIADMRGSVAQRKHLAKVLTVRALRGALERAKENS
ncbi:MAG: xanthine dehydrogenase family protein subunit M [Dehalococcoidia bacterium]|nr:xanthine dehydrogenase family protein subunit M [Dehalococcoidia bacterium]MCA9843025.1 xanthine dehydrogenase family protein subunit M [Dehalococcoidia bacterium]MCA9852067.1 xanthine dehydrogenase family protein subunit M [Dehalococcoidia bacterium]